MKGKQQKQDAAGKKVQKSKKGKQAKAKKPPSSPKHGTPMATGGVTVPITVEFNVHGIGAEPQQNAEPAPEIDEGW